MAKGSVKFQFRQIFFLFVLFCFVVVFFFFFFLFFVFCFFLICAYFISSMKDRACSWVDHKRYSASASSASRDATRLLLSASKSAVFSSSCFCFLLKRIFIMYKTENAISTFKIRKLYSNLNENRKSKFKSEFKIQNSKFKIQNSKF